jgi:hypothetical protein
MVGWKSDTLGLRRLNRKRIQPIWLPAVVETIEQPKVMSVQMEYRRTIASVSQRENHNAAPSSYEGGRGRNGEIRWPHPFGPAEGEVEADRAAQVELGRKVARRERRGLRKRCGPERRLR